MILARFIRGVCGNPRRYRRGFVLGLRQTRHPRRIRDRILVRKLLLPPAEVGPVVCDCQLVTGWRGRGGWGQHG